MSVLVLFPGIHNFLAQGPQGTAAFKRQRNAI
jgi:hypothetical protein